MSQLFVFWSEEGNSLLSVVSGSEPEAWKRLDKLLIKRPTMPKLSTYSLKQTAEEVDEGIYAIGE